MKLSGLRKLFFAGVISLRDYLSYRKLKRRHHRKIKHTRKQFDLNKYTDDECLLLFRFKKHEIRQLCKCLELPEYFVLPNRNRCSGTEGLCLVLRRLSYPNRLCDLVTTFNRDVGTLSKFFNCCLHFVYQKWNGKLTSLLNHNWLTQRELYNLSQACQVAGSYYDSMVGFIDGTARPICRPKYNQRSQYSGYKKIHCFKYQSIVLPNGLIARLDGPFNGRRHDAAVLQLSNLKNELTVLFEKNNGLNFCLYGDTGYSNQKFIKCGFKNYHGLTQRQKSFNRDMSALRVSVEYGFGKILQQFAFLDFKKNRKMFLQNLKYQYVVAALLVNCQNCLRGDQVSEYFNCMPPSLESYLQN